MGLELFEFCSVIAMLPVCKCSYRRQSTLSYHLQPVLTIKKLVHLNKSYVIMEETFVDEEGNTEGTLAIEIVGERKCLNTKKQYRLKFHSF